MFLKKPFFTYFSRIILKLISFFKFFHSGSFKRFKLKPLHQSPDEIVDITDWEYDDEYPFYPEGSRDKYLLFCPNQAPYKFLRRDNPYLFKLPRDRYPTQYWAEIIAYRVGCLMDVGVPPAFVAIDKDEDQPGTLIQWFYNYPSNPPSVDIYIRGGSFMTRLIPNFDQKKGSQHNVQTLMRIMRIFLNITDSINHWARVFVFDVIIGNTDRHQDNWGIVFRRNGQNSEKRFLSPAFDNGTSLGHEIMESKLNDFKDPSRLNSYINRGRHHIKWQIEDDRPCGHIELLKKFSNKYPESKAIMLNCLSFSDKVLKETLVELTKFKINDPLTEDRCFFVINLILERKKLITESLEG